MLGGPAEAPDGIHGFGPVPAFREARKLCSNGGSITLFTATFVAVRIRYRFVRRLSSFGDAACIGALAVHQPVEQRTRHHKSLAAAGSLGGSSPQAGIGASCLSPSHV